jgi:hypothetical protein
MVLSVLTFHPFLCGEDAPVTIFGFDNKTIRYQSLYQCDFNYNAQNVILNVSAPAACDLKADTGV